MSSLVSFSVGKDIKFEANREIESPPGNRKREKKNTKIKNQIGSVSQKDTAQSDKKKTITAHCSILWYCGLKILKRTTDEL